MIFGELQNICSDVEIFITGAERIRVWPGIEIGRKL